MTARLWYWLHVATHALENHIPIRALDWVCDHYDRAIDQEADA